MDRLGLHWAVRGDAPALVLDVVLDVGPSNVCRVGHGLAQGEGAGLRRLTLLMQEGAPSWTSGPTGAQGVHAGTLDTRSADGAGATAITEVLSGPMQGEVRIVLLAQGLQAWGTRLLAPGTSAALSVACDEPMALLSEATGDSLVLADAARLAGGAGLAAGDVDVNGLDAVAADLAGQRSWAACAGFGAHGGAAVLRHDGGGHSWMLPPDPGLAPATLDVTETVPGSHVWQATRVAAADAAFWCAAWGADLGGSPLRVADTGLAD